MLKCNHIIDFYNQTKIHFTCGTSTHRHKDNRTAADVRLYINLCVKRMGQSCYVVCAQCFRSFDRSNIEENSNKNNMRIFEYANY